MKKYLITGLLLAVLAVGGWWAYAHRSAIDTPRAQPSPSTAAPSQQSSSDKTETAELEKTLNSAEGKTQLTALAPTLREQYVALGQERFLPEDAKLTLDASTFKVSGDAANVDAAMSAPNAPTTSVVLILVRESANSPWQILDFKQK